MKFCLHHLNFKSYLSFEKIKKNMFFEIELCTIIYLKTGSIKPKQNPS